jgi:hypothetical protein
MGEHGDQEGISFERHMANGVVLDWSPILLGNPDKARGHRTSHVNDGDSLRRVGRDSSPLSRPQRGDYCGDTRTASSFCRNAGHPLPFGGPPFPPALHILPAP